LFIGCSTVSTPYNTPFINADETIQLYEGMSKNDVLDKVGGPLYVESGINNTIVWIYEVRLIEVQSDTDPISKKVTFKKTSANTRHSDPIHQIQIVFIDNKIKKWEMVIKKEEKVKVKTETTKKNVEKKKEKKKKKKKKEKTVTAKPTEKSNWIISPSMWLVSTHDDMGYGLGFSMLKGNLGFEMNNNWTIMEESEGDYLLTVNYSTLNGLFLYNKNYKKFTTQLGAGMSLISSAPDNPMDYNNPVMNHDPKEENGSAELFLRVSIGKHLSYKKLRFTPMLEMNYFNEEVGFSVMSRFNFDL
jgi:outer membrane protein assembly factor BamE (lipoprotein component of BamABCDE complex)